MSKLEIKLSDSDIKSAQNINNDNYIKKYLEKRYPGLNFSFLDKCGVISFNSINFNNINVLMKKLNDKINDFLNKHEDLLIWGDAPQNSNYFGYAKENCRYVINIEDTNEFTIEKFVKDLSDDGYMTGITSSEAVKKLSEGTGYEQTTYQSLDEAKKECVKDFKKLLNLKELYWIYSEKTKSLTANTAKGVYEIIEISPKNYNISIAKGSEYQELSGNESDIKKAIKICENNLYEKINKTKGKEQNLEI